MSINLRQGEITDLEIINQIYNQAVARKYQTADLAPIEMPQRHIWFNEHDKVRYPIHVIEIDNKVIGWSSLSKYRKGREALKSTAEISYYIDINHQGLGHGSYLIERTIHLAKEIGFRNLVAILLSSNEASIGILSKFKFKEWGRIPKAAHIDGKSFDHLFYGCNIT